MAKTNDYTATATAEKRLIEVLQGQLSGYDFEPQFFSDLSQALCAETTIELKPRLKAVQITIPIPQPKPEPKLGKFEPRPAPEDGYEDDVTVE